MWKIIRAAILVAYRLDKSAKRVPTQYFFSIMVFFAIFYVIFLFLNVCCGSI